MGEVVLYHILEAVAAKSPSGKTIVDINKYRPMVRMGGNFYGVVGQVSVQPVEASKRGPITCIVLLYILQLRHYIYTVVRRQRTLARVIGSQTHE